MSPLQDLTQRSQRLRRGRRNKARDPPSPRLRRARASVLRSCGAAKEEEREIPRRPPRNLRALRVKPCSRCIAGYYLTVTAAAVDGMPLATTSSWPAPVSIPDGTSKFVVTVFEPVATPIELWSWVRQ